jgi:HlyD family secretion protein
MKLLQKPSANGHTTRIETITLGAAPSRRRWWIAGGALLALAAIFAFVFVVRARSEAAVVYTTAPVTRGTLVSSVTATGTVNPQNTVAVGTQISGTIDAIDADFNSHVKTGQVLAKIDPTTFQAALAQAQAGLAQAQAQEQSAAATASGAQFGIGGAAASETAAQATAQAAADTARSNEAAVATANANVEKSQSALTLAQQTVARDKQLLSQGYIAQSQYDTDESNLVAAQTTLDSAKAAVSQAQLTAQSSVSAAAASQAQTSAQAYAASTAQSTAQTQVANVASMAAAVASAQAQVQTAELNLQHTIITSPVDGTVVARDVSVGTTVASGLQTPTLYSIAQNLNKMEVDVAVGEPDIGNVRSGDGVDFSVLAYPNVTFHGVVSQVRIDPTTTNNVVTYDTVVLVNNQDGRLLPGMTANATIDVAKTEGALIVPLAALSYHPAFAGTAHSHRTAGSASSANGTASSPWGATTGSGASASTGGTQRIFVDRSGKLVRVPVTVVLESGTQVAVKPASGTLVAGDLVVTADSSAATSAQTSHAQAGNPLTGGFGGSNGATRGLH